MTPIEELIATVDRVCNTLDELANNEKRFCDNILFEFERMSWESMKISNDLKQVKEYVGGRQ